MNPSTDIKTFESPAQVMTILSGPSYCGKSTWAALHYPGAHIVSSDTIRRTLLGRDADRYEPEMLHVSKQAFQILEATVASLMQYPVLSNRVVVDTTGLNEDFRKHMIQLAHKNHYEAEIVIFDYKNREDYLSYLQAAHPDTPVGHSAPGTSIVRRHIKRLAEYVLPTLARHRIPVHRVRENDFSKYRCIQKDRPFFDEDALVVGDIHGCYDTFVKLLERQQYFVQEDLTIKTARTQKIVLAGDLIDKGAPQSIAKLLKLVLKNPDLFRIVEGNHERFIAMSLEAGRPDPTVPEGVVETFFTSVQKDETGWHFLSRELHEDSYRDFKEILNRSLPFYRSKSMIVTHAPCESQYLGKLTTAAKKSQRNIRLYGSQKDIHDKAKSYNQILSFLQTEAQGGQPYHFFGHVALRAPYISKNKVGIDTGAVHGNKLTIAWIQNERIEYESIQVEPHEALQKEELPRLFQAQEMETAPIDLNLLTPHEKRRLRAIESNQIRFVSGTMSPSNKFETDLESLSSGLHYFQKAGVKELVLQPKYMGSRCNAYIFPELEKCFAVSRAGFKIKVDLTPLWEPLQKRFLVEGVSHVILDGELMPWRALGAGLIDERFIPYSNLVREELDQLNRSGFFSAFAIIQAEYDQNKQEFSQLDKKALKEKFGHKTQTYSALREASLPYQGQYAELRAFDHQVKLYGGDGSLEFKPFARIAQIREGHYEVMALTDAEENFRSVSGDTSITIQLDAADALDKARAFFDHVTKEREMEGVVLKPKDQQYAFANGVVPCMKVRNPEYLKIVYGPDYQGEKKYQKLLRKKSIHSKLRASYEEWKYGVELLGVDQTKEPMKYKNRVAHLIMEERREQGIDPRL